MGRTLAEAKDLRSVLEAAADLAPPGSTIGKVLGAASKASKLDRASVDSRIRLVANRAEEKAVEEALKRSRLHERAIDALR